MSVYKCKMCGGTIEFEPGASVGTCDSCGTKQTLPSTDNESISNLFNRANSLRLKCEFDKAEQLYEKILETDDTQAEAHWGIVLCKYGIEYVEDPQTFKRVPTCHRTLFEAVTTDADYLAAIDYSDTLQQTIYEKEAREIDRIQRDILAIVKNEEPFDIFICYKETDENGRRTVDSTISNDIYYQLTAEGFKVFYAPITLEDKIGQEYEPYIFAALNSAKVMLVVGTKSEYFSSVWVKNEWSRFIKIIKNDRSKLLIPCYRDMDPYDLPDDFAHLQAQDMSKIGFVNDLVRGIKKVIVPVSESAAQPQPAPAQSFVSDNKAGSAFNTVPQNTDIKSELTSAAHQIGSVINNSFGKIINSVEQPKQNDVSVAPHREIYDNYKPDKLKGKSRILALLLCLFAGAFGVHNFYLGDVKKGIIRILLSFIGVGFILAIVDFFKLLFDTYEVS